MTFVARLLWDPGNVAHIARHGVTPDEVEQVCHGQPAVSGSYDGRIRVLGITLAGRMIMVILAPRGEDTYLPVTVRPASRIERNRYAALQKDMNHGSEQDREA